MWRILAKIEPIVLILDEILEHWLARLDNQAMSTVATPRQKLTRNLLPSTEPLQLLAAVREAGPGAHLPPDDILLDLYAACWSDAGSTPRPRR